MDNINANSTHEEEEIIIKCSLEEMMKAFFNDYVVVWHDPNVDSQENQKYITKLKQFCQVFTFTEWQKAKDHIKLTQAVCHVITSGTNGELLTKEISPSQSVMNIYVFCQNQEYHSTWAQNYPKVACVETQIEAVLTKIEQNLLEWYQEASSRKLSLPAFAPIFNDSDKSEMNYLHHYLKVIPNFHNREQAKQDFLALSKNIYSDQVNAKLLEEFENTYHEYNKEQTLRWYTTESFFYKVANNCLRIATSDSIQYCRLALRDIEQAIKDHYQTTSKNFNGLLYRGAYLSEPEWLNLQENRDKEIEMLGFLSVSKVKNVALNFMKDDPSKKVFITIIVPKGPNEEEQGFAEVEHFSHYPYEKEILFNVRSRFTVLQTEDDYIYSETSKCRHLVLLYGAQGFRQFMTEANPIQEVSILDMGTALCAHCKVNSLEMPEKVVFLSLENPNKQAYYCKKCLDFGVSPFLWISTMDKVGKQYATKIKGFPLIMNARQEQVPHCGSQCCNCKAKKQKAYFTCIDCDEKWCEDCFEKMSKCGHQNIIFETSPFSFWCQNMSANELIHRNFHKNFMQEDAGIFQQAEMYYKNHKYEKAIEYYNLYIQENKAKGNDENIATSFNKIGIIYYDQGEYEKALQHYYKAIDIRKALHGENHPDTAASFNNVAIIYVSQGQQKKALEYYSKSLDIRISIHGENHPDTAASFNNIASLYDDQGEYKKALEYYSKSLEIYKSIYGDNHRETAISFNNIGIVYEHQEEREKAMEFYFKSLEIYKSIYGDNHPSTADAFNNIGIVYENQEEYKKALEYYSKSLNIRASIHGENHPNTAASFNNIANIFKYQGEPEKALEYYSKSLDIRKSVFGDNHALTADSFKNIGILYNSLKEYEKALEYYFNCLDIYQSVYGDNHPSTANSLETIGSISYNLKEYEQALEYHFKALDIRKCIYGENHSDTADSYYNIGIVYKNQGKSNKALEYYSKSLDISKSIYGNDHPLTIQTQNVIKAIPQRKKFF